MIIPSIDSWWNRLNPFTNTPVHEEVFNRAGGVPGITGAAAGGLGGYSLGSHLKKKYDLGFLGDYLPVILGAAGFAGGGLTGRFLSGTDKRSHRAGLMAEAGLAYLDSIKKRQALL